LFPCTSCVIIVRFDLSQSVDTAAVQYLLPLKLYGTELFMIWHQFGIKRPCFVLGCNWHFFSKVAVAWADEDFSSIMGKCWESMSHEAEKCDLIITGRQTPAGREASPCWPSASFSARHKAWVNVTGSSYRTADLFPSLTLNTCMSLC